VGRTSCRPILNGPGMLDVLGSNWVNLENVFLLNGGCFELDVEASRKSPGSAVKTRTKLGSSQL
jgi:hypothetical protein